MAEPSSNIPRRHEKYQRLVEFAKALQPITVAVAHPCDESSLSGAVNAAKIGLIKPILVGPRAKIEAVAKEHHLDVSRYEHVDTPHSHASAAKAVEIVREGRAEALMKGSLLGVSGVSSDMRALLGSVEPRAKLAVDLFVYRIGRELGSLAAALGGLDAIVFTAGIGEHAAPIRARVCRDAAWLGVELDEGADDRSGPRRIGTPGSRTAAWVIPTDEELMIARHTRKVLAH